MQREYLPAVAAADPVNGCFNRAGDPIPCRPVESCSTPVVDEDLDGLYDASDPTCNLVTDVEVCGNELDEDRDGIAQMCTGPTNTIQNTEHDTVHLNLAPATADARWTYSAPALRALGLSITPGGDPNGSPGGLVTGQISHDAAGARVPMNADIEVFVDRFGAVSREAFTWQVWNKNRPPTLIPPIDVESTEGDAIRFPLTHYAMDSDCGMANPGDPIVTDPDCPNGLHFAFTDAAQVPDGLRLDPNGVIGGVVGHGAADHQHDPRGYRVEVEVADGEGGAQRTSFFWLIRDSPVEAPPPVCVDAYASPDELWPPNGRFQDIAIAGVDGADPDDPVSITVDGIWQDEPVGRPRGRPRAPDGHGVGTQMASVRAERIGAGHRGGGNGRVYSIAFTATDGAGASCTGAVSVSVPLSRHHPSVDDAARFDSTVNFR